MKHLSYLIETIVLLAALSLINFIWIGDNPGFLGISPHPYWIVVIGISVKYELKQSLLASFLSSLTYGIFLFALHDFTLAEFFEFEAIKPVFLFMIFASLIGKVRSGQVEKLEGIIKEKDGLEKSNLQLQERYDKAIKVNNELSDRIFYQTYSYSTIYEMAKRISKISIANLIPETLKFISDAMEIEKCSFYLFRSGQFELVSARGWDEQDTKRSALINSNKIVQQVLKDKEIRAVNDFLDNLEDEVPLSIESDVIISSPIIYGLDKRVLGIINIEKIPFNRFNSDSFSLLKIVADWISDSIDDADELMISIKIDQQRAESEHPINGKLNNKLKLVYPLFETKED